MRTIPEGCESIGPESQGACMVAPARTASAREFVHPWTVGLDTEPLWYQRCPAGWPEDAGGPHAERIRSEHPMWHPQWGGGCPGPREESSSASRAGAVGGAPRGVLGHETRAALCWSWRAFRDPDGTPGRWISVRQLTSGLT